MKLIRRSGPMPTGGYPFRDPRTGIFYKGLEGSFMDQVYKIRSDRIRNGKLYPPGEEAGKFLRIEVIGDELDDYVCGPSNLNGNPKFCSDGNINSAAPLNQKTERTDKTCAACQSPLDGIYCPTCVGKRLLYYKCSKCGKEYPK